MPRSEPPAARTLGDLVDEMARRVPRVEAVVARSARLDYATLKHAVDAVARGFLARGVGRGDHVGILLGNRAEWVVTWLAVNRIGGVVVGISTWSSAAELGYVLRHSDTKLLVCGDALGPRNLASIVNECLGSAAWTDAAPASAALPCLRAVVRMEGAAMLDANIAPLVRDGEAVSAARLDARAREVRPGDVALLLYTSGSTATPKGVQLVHGTLIAHAFDIGEAEALGAGDRYWISLPLFWSAGSANTTMAVLTHGATAVLQEFFDPAEAVRLLRDERCTHYFAFPNVTQAIHRALGDAPRLPAARTAVTSGQPEILALLRTMGFTRLLHPYGTTEDYGFATINDPGDSDEVLGWSQGRPLPGIELRICDPATGAVLARGNAGEICLRGNVTPGYYKDEDKNRAAFDREGFFHTADAAIQHVDGRLQFLGRLKEMIKTSGFNVSPAEVEAALLALPGVIEAYVVPVPDAERGQSVAACVRVSTPAISADALRRHCTGTLSSYKVPRVFLMLDSFPMTATGKVSKEALRELATKHAATGGT
jgi:fatty-acyl-CoA synthase